MFGFFRRKKKEKEDAAAAQAAAAEFAANEEAAAEPAGESAEGGEPAGGTQAPEALQPRDVAQPQPEAGQAVAAETSGVGTAGDVTVAEPAAAPAEVSSALPQAGPNAMPTPRAEAPLAGVPHVPSAEVSEAPRPQSTPVEAAPALKETVAAKEAAAPVEAVAPQVPAEPVVEVPPPEAVVSAPTVEAPTQQAPSVPAVSEDASAPTSGEATTYGESEIVPPTQAMPEAVRPARAGWFARLRGGLARTRSQLGSIFSRNRIDETLYEELETALLASDTGYGTTTWLLDELRERAQRDRINDAATLKTALIDILTELLSPLEKPIDVDRADPLVMMITGVNGAGKTTSIGKLARHLHQIDQSVLLAAGDTFRAAAREQLARWGERNQVHVIANEGGDPAAVAFDAIKAGQARKVDVVMVDTAGRLPTQRHLMDELKKIRRVIGKAMDGAPHEVLLVLDGNTGQNMLAQVQAFDEAVQLTGLVVTKLDGTAKGGAIAALAHTRRDNPLPVYFIGVGEGVEDLQAFSAREFATALLD
ncbi:signal recognition particle-docking protein FtsY [Lautropia mirabilis ATCC 51599]|jgi:signal recognition particle-docking protein ftsY|uniref:Signal recognition particle receptor FtsY n=2 Tax=Lautropia mirabilis TaxID=47671 RepID=E7S0E7_9BURK|nr:signal recognition particle-docking protein FtsY [Lautropia mirabilis]EFV94296.1 signal recognition particle-docking protein FtsY [Lautropia mirabilis ATCC 51599]VEG99464.1 Cell division protein FtsY homolog [Lautropia mirabilis]